MMTSASSLEISANSFCVSQHFRSLLVGFPLKMLQELCGLDANRARQVSRSVIFSPISTVSESCDPLYEFPNCGFPINMRKAHNNRLLLCRLLMNNRKPEKRVPQSKR